MFHLLNAAGKDLEASVRYRIDKGQWQAVKTQQTVVLSEKLKSGKHSLEAICEGDTLQRDFVVFALNDQVPATETDDWFYQSATQFPADVTGSISQLPSSLPTASLSPFKWARRLPTCISSIASLLVRKYLRVELLTETTS